MARLQPDPADDCEEHLDAVPSPVVRATNEMAEYWLETPPSEVALLSIGKTLSQIPETDLCPFCGGLACRVLLRYETPYREARQLHVARCEDVPGYRCTMCENETYDLEATTQVLLAAREVAYRAGDMMVAGDLDAIVPMGAS